MSSRNKRKKIKFECYICGERTDHSRICCGHPMTELVTGKDVVRWERSLVGLERV